MRTIKAGFISKTEIKVYDSIKELGIVRYQEFQKLLLQDIGIGSDINAIAKHFNSLYSFITHDKKEEAIQEAQNLHNNFYMMISKINIKSHCFACLVYEVNGEKVKDFTDDGVRKTLKKIKALKASQVEDILDEVKKNLKQNFNPTFLTDTQVQKNSTHTLNSKGGVKRILGMLWRKIKVMKKKQKPI